MTIRKLGPVLGIAGTGVFAALALSACGSGTRTIGRDDSNYSFGYNYVNGKSVYCKYVDDTVVRKIPGGNTSAVHPTNHGTVAAGLTTTNRATILSEGKASAIATLLGSRPAIEQIGSCDLACEEQDDQDDTAYPEVAFGGADDRGSDPSTSGASQASTTNNQVAGVDEADFIKNDNKYMYVVANNRLKIIDAFPASTAHTIADIAITKGTPTQLFLGTDRLVVYSTVGGQTNGSPACTYGYDCVPTGDGNATHVTIFDITNRAAPAVVRELDFSGSLIAARKIGDAIHTVVYDPPLAKRIASLSTPPKLSRSCYDRRDNIDVAAADLAKQLDERVKAIEALTDGGPTVSDSGARLEPSFRASNLKGDQFLSLISFGLTSSSLTAETLVSKAGFVYASTNSLYVSVPQEQATSEDWYQGYGNEAHASEVFKFAIGANPSATTYIASGLVKGSVLNQFAMDEWNGNLRIATTSGRAPDPSVHSTLTVLETNGLNLTQKGILDNIAPTEDIRSVRFDGDRGFLVTFKKTDPLFAIDLSNPAAPVTKGELKIPGFSTYMHFMDKTHILAIGLEADDHGSFAFFNGIQLQIFDISDMSAPTLLHKTVIGTRGTNSEALTNHLGFNYFAPKNLLALPMTTCEGGGDGSFGTNMTFNGLLVYDVTVANGFASKGGISHPVADGVTCSNWWTNQNSTVKRSVIMDNFVYSVSEDDVRIADAATLGTVITDISLK